MRWFTASSGRGTFPSHAQTLESAMETAKAKKKMGLTESLAWLGLAAMFGFVAVWVVGFLSGVVYGILASGFKVGALFPWLPS